MKIKTLNNQYVKQINQNNELIEEKDQNIKNYGELLDEMPILV